MKLSPAMTIPVDRPEPGFWATRMASGGVEVACRIFRVWTKAEPGHPTNLMERSPFLAAELNGELCDIWEVWHRRRRPISEAEYKFLVADRQWAHFHAPGDPAAAPGRKVSDRDRVAAAPVAPLTRRA